MGDPIWGTYEAVGVHDEVLLPEKYALYQNYPNPFNPSTTIKFDIVNPGQVSLKIYNVMGQEVANLIDRNMEAGFHYITWIPRTLTSGVYFYRIKTTEFAKVRKLVLVK